ncbi:hypothetical protein JL_51 [Bacillus phage JL]|uniref:Uncharacterized protein n=1 Tax=Bacillus phage JL TaxID=1296655 RepID=S5MAE0_9CAUD|nr:hypothetical protein AVV47_gp051 [Bacillus phage JL]AGR46739.1 hypothetical protein JL_51 [Bacillus phage JL]
MEVRIPPKDKSIPLPERVGSVIVDNDTDRAYMLAVNPADMNTPYLMGLDGEGYSTVERIDSEPCTMVTYGDIENSLSTGNFTVYTTKNYMLDLVERKPS